MLSPWKAAHIRVNARSSKKQLFQKKKQVLHGSVSIVIWLSPIWVITGLKKWSTPKQQADLSNLPIISSSFWALGCFMNRSKTTQHLVSLETASSVKALMKFFSPPFLFLLAPGGFRVQKVGSHLLSDLQFVGQTNKLKWKISDPRDLSKTYKLGQALKRAWLRSMPSKRTCCVGAAPTVSCLPDFWPVVWPVGPKYLAAGCRR